MSYMKERDIIERRELPENQLAAVGCSQCGGSFPKPDDPLYRHGFSHCEDHHVSCLHSEINDDVENDTTQGRWK